MFVDVGSKFHALTVHLTRQINNETDYYDEYNKEQNKKEHLFPRFGLGEICLW